MDRAYVDAPSSEDYAECVRASERVSWKLDDILPRHRELDFSRPFLPDALVHLSSAPIPDASKLALDHVRAHSYVNLFIFVEEYIIATALRHAQAEQFGSVDALRALVRFADEELKHQQLFRRCQEAFARGFGHECAVLDNAAEVAGYILEQPALSVMLVTLHLELVTQQHYVGAIKSGPESIDPTFRRIFEAHWIEESQHARIDALEIAKLVAQHTRDQLVAAIASYEDILASLDALLLRQTEMDVDTWSRVVSHRLSPDERAALIRHQHASYRRNFLHDGLEHGAMARTLQRMVGDDGPARLSQIAARFR